MKYRERGGTREKGTEKSKTDGEVGGDEDKKKINCVNYLYSRYQAVRRRSLTHATHKYAFERSRVAATGGRNYMSSHNRKVTFFHATS